MTATVTHLVSHPDAGDFAMCGLLGDFAPPTRIEKTVYHRVNEKN